MIYAMIAKGLTFLGLICVALSARNDPSVEENAEFWNRQAQDTLKSTLSMRPNLNVAKNVILFLGDGMGLSTITAGRIYKGQLEGYTGEEANLAFDKFPHSALIKTYNVDRQTSDSAGTATAFLCGVKANAGTVGVDSRALRKNCTLQRGKEVDSILKSSLAEGKSVGIVTNTRLSHATPAASYAHSSERNWEGDAHMKDVEGGCKDITYQLIKDNPEIQVILGGGRRTFIPYNVPDPITGKTDSENGRMDGKNLIEEWKLDKEERKVKHKVLYNKTDIKNTDTENVDYLLGVFSTSHMAYEVDRNETDEPSIAEMTELAIKVLNNNPKGFFLLVEGGRIDHAHHESFGRRALHEVLAFNEAVECGKKSTNEKDSLIVVTADHSHVFVIGGYPSRGNDIIGLTDVFGTEQEEWPKDGKPATTLMYGNGPGYTEPRENLTGVDVRHVNFRQQSVVNMKEETHGGEDVTVYAAGPMAHLFHGVHEQNYIAHVMAYASCVGQNKDHCKRKTHTTRKPTGGQSGLKHSRGLVVVMVFVVTAFSTVTLWQ